jgi:hypothetical protein
MLIGMTDYNRVIFISLHFIPYPPSHFSILKWRNAWVAVGLLLGKFIDKSYNCFKTIQNVKIIMNTNKISKDCNAYQRFAIYRQQQKAKRKKKFFF